MWEWVNADVPYSGLQVVDADGWRQVPAQSFVDGLEQLERLQGPRTIYRRTDGGRAAVGRDAVHFLVHENSVGRPLSDIGLLRDELTEYWRWRTRMIRAWERARAWGAAETSWKVTMVMQEGKMSWMAAEDRAQALDMLALIEGLCPSPPPAAELGDGGRVLNLSSPGEGVEFCAWVAQGPLGWPLNFVPDERFFPCPKLSKTIDRLGAPEVLQDVKERLVSAEVDFAPEPRQQMLTGEAQIYETSETDGDRWWWYPSDAAAFSDLVKRALVVGAEIWREGRVWGFTHAGRSVGVFSQSRGPVGFEV